MLPRVFVHFKQEMVQGFHPANVFMNEQEVPSCLLQPCFVGCGLHKLQHLIKNTVFKISLIVDINEITTKLNKLIREEDATYEDISSLKSTINDIKQFEENGILVDIQSLIINKRRSVFMACQR